MKLYKNFLTSSSKGIFEFRLGRSTWAHIKQLHFWTYKTLITSSKLNLFISKYKLKY